MSARFQIGGAVRRDQSGHVRDMHPDTISVHAQRIVGVLVAGVVDGEGWQVRQVQPLLVGQGGSGTVGSPVGMFNRRGCGLTISSQ